MKIIKSSQLDENFFNRYTELNLPQVNNIIDKVKQKGDEALKEFTRQFDGVNLDEFILNLDKIDENEIEVEDELKEAIQYSIENLEKFAREQLKSFNDFEIEIRKGVFTGQKIIPINRVGVYVPGGRFPLFSSLLMGGVPAQVAGVSQITVCTPPDKNGSVHPAILYSAKAAGVKEIIKLGGAQAIAALAYGTESIIPVNKIVGPGNSFVTMAKKEVFGKVGIDFIAGPSEILIIADDTANPKIVATDMLAQAEHDVEAQAILITNSNKLAAQVSEEIKEQLKKLTTGKIASASIQNNGVIIIVANLEEAVTISEKIAPEHLEIQTSRNDYLQKNLNNYGSLFSGNNAAEVFGDYSSGLNHTLPTAEAAKYTGGLGVKDFIKIQTTLRMENIKDDKIIKSAYVMAKNEGLEAHANAAAARK